MNKEIARILLDIKAVHLSPDDFFTWTSGIKSPIYCDNRQIISYPNDRNIVVDQYIKLIKQKYPNTEVIAGTATAGIPWAAFIADRMNLPMIYIRSSAKGHGLKNAIEGHSTSGQKVVLIEDLISTGKSSVKAGLDVIEAKLELLGVVSIFSYGLDISKNKFSEVVMNYDALCDLDALLSYAASKNILSESQVEIVREWKNTVSL